MLLALLLRLDDPCDSEQAQGGQFILIKFGCYSRKCRVSAESALQTHKSGAFTEGTFLSSTPHRGDKARFRKRAIRPQDSGSPARR